MSDPTATELPYAHGPPALQGQLRTVPEDFSVREESNFVLDGAGEHVWLWIRKRDTNTDWVARQLARQAGVPLGAIGYAGLKDRHAVTEQWFSVHLPGRPEPDWTDLADPNMRVLKAVRHSRKLRRGALSANTFQIVIRELEGNPDDLADRLCRIITTGVPNYFGEQRFGREGGNLERAEAMLSGQEKIRDRHRRGLYLSAARSALFNAVLARRVSDCTWNQGLPGDVLMLDGSHSIFNASEMDDTLRQRIAACDLHPTGPLWGAGELRSGSAVRALEETVANTLPLFRDGLVAEGLQQERRALRLTAKDASIEFLAPHIARVHFRLAAGSYATSILRELVRPLEQTSST